MQEKAWTKGYLYELSFFVKVLALLGIMLHGDERENRCKRLSFKYKTESNTSTDTQQLSGLISLFERNISFSFKQKKNNTSYSEKQRPGLLGLSLLLQLGYAFKMYFEAEVRTKKVLNQNVPKCFLS